MYHTRFKLYLFSFPCTSQSEVYKRNFSRGLFLYNLFLWIFGLSFLVSLCSLVQHGVFHRGDLMNDWWRENKKKRNETKTMSGNIYARTESVHRSACRLLQIYKMNIIQFVILPQCPSVIALYIFATVAHCLLPQQQPLTFLDRLVHSTSMAGDFTYGLPEGGKISGS